MGPGLPLPQAAVVVKADKGADHQARRIAHEPGGAEIVGGTGLAGDVAAEARHRGGSAVGGHPLQHQGDLVGGHRIHHRHPLRGQPRGLVAIEGLVAVGAVALVHLPDGLALPVLDHLDQVRLDPAAAIGKGGIGGGDLVGGGLAGPQRHGQHRLQVVHHAGAHRHVADLAHAHLVGDADRHLVAGIDETGAEDGGPAALVLVILRRPDLAIGAGKADRRVQHDGGGGEAVLQGRGIDEGLEGRAGLPLRLGGAVELGEGEAVAPHHGQHPAAAGVEGHQGTIDDGHLPQTIGAAVAGGLHEHQVADRQTLALPGPGHVGGLQLPLAALGQAHMGAAAADPVDHRRPPGPAFGGRGLGQGFLLPAGLQVHMLQRAAPAVAAVIGLEPLHQGDAGLGLQAAVEGGAHVEPALLRLLADGGLRPLADLLHEVVGIAVVGPLGPQLDVQVLAHGGLGLGPGDEALLRHLGQHPVAAAQGLGAVAQRIVVGRTLGQAGQIGHLRQVELVHRLAEVVVGRRPHAERAIAQPDLVQIELENPGLGQGLLDPAGEDGLLDLAAEAVLPRQQDVLGHLLGDGGAALQLAPAQDVEGIPAHGPGQAGQVDAPVLEELAVLRRQEGADQQGRYLVIGGEDAPLLADLADQGAVPGIDPGGGGRAIVPELGGVGQVVEQPGRIDGQHDPRNGDQAQAGHTCDRHPSSCRLQRAPLRPWPAPRWRPIGRSKCA